MASEGKKDDFTPQIDAAISSAEARAKGGDLAGAVEDLLSLEKKTRAAGDAFATSRVCVAVAKLCFEMRDMKQLNAQILVLSKRRGQLKQAITDLVQTCMGFIDSVKNKDDRVELITTLKTVTEGKIYVEVERARVTKQLAAIQEEEGKVNEASETLQEVQVETFGSMETKEKAEFILEQMRLTMRQRDFVRMGIISNKINKGTLDEAGFEDIRLRYYGLMALLNHSRHDTVALCKGYLAVLATRGFKDSPEKWKPALSSAVLFAALSPWSNEVSDLLHRLKADKRTEELPSYAALLKMLTTQEVIPWPLPAPHHDVLRADPAFSIDPNTIGAPGGAGGGVGAGGASSSSSSSSSSAAGRGGMDIEAGGSSAGSSASSSSSSSSAAGGGGVGVAGRARSVIVLKEDESRSQWWPIFYKRIVQHNIRVCSGAYARMRFARLASVLDLDAATTEAMVSELVSSKGIWARIDRPAGVIVFERPRPATEVLTDWAGDLEQILGLVEKTTHLIQKEYMVHGVTS